MIFRAMEATGVTDVRAVAVAGDTVVDLRAGMNAGCAIVAGVATGKLTHADLGGEPHTHLIDSGLPALPGSQIGIVLPARVPAEPVPAGKAGGR